MRGITAAAATLAAIACITSTLGAQGGLSRLGVSQQDAGDRFVEAVQGGGSPSIAARAFLALAPAARAAAVTDVVAWAKTYYKSAAFKKAWAEAREANKPDPPAGSVDAAVSKQSSDIDNSIAEMKKLMASLPPDQRASMQDTIKQLEATAHDPAYLARQKSMAESMHGDDVKKYQTQMQDWQQNYPVDPTPLIAKQLREFLAATDGVDFDAKLVSVDGGKVFAKPEYEHKPSQWKMAYRAGREATSAARTAAAAWLKELAQQP